MKRFNLTRDSADIQLDPISDERFSALLRLGYAAILGGVAVAVTWRCGLAGLLSLLLAGVVGIVIYYLCFEY